MASLILMGYHLNIDRMFNVDISGVLQEKIVKLMEKYKSSERETTLGRIFYGDGREDFVTLMNSYDICVSPHNGWDRDINDKINLVISTIDGEQCLSLGSIIDICTAEEISSYEYDEYVCKISTGSLATKIWINSLGFDFLNCIDGEPNSPKVIIVTKDDY